jgi:hypothetical protein
MPVAITDPELLARQALPDEDFLDHFVGLLAHIPPREWTRESFEHGLRYPWTRPERSYLLRDGEALLLHELAPAEREATLQRHVGPRAPLIAFGSNAAPKNLALKLAHHEDPEDREVLVLYGELHDLDVVAAAAVAFYGAMPATLTASPGTSVSAALLLVNAAQLTTLTWGELPYRIGRLHGAGFTVEEGVEPFDVGSPLAFVSRWGAFAPDGAPAPLAAVAGRDRRSPAWEQRELLDRVAQIVLGEGGGEALLRALVTDVAGMAARAIPVLREYAQPFEFPGWVAIGPDGRL